MRVIETKVYTFDELDEKAKAKAIEDRRQLDQGDTFAAECVVYDFVNAIAPHMGWRIDKAKVYFSGFCSQGDGACFAGYWDADKVYPSKLRAERPTDMELLRIVDGYAELAKACAANPDRDGEQCSARVKHSGPYYHKYCTVFDVEGMTDGQEKEFIELSRDLMQHLYRALEQEHDYQNSDECISDLLEASEWEFTSDGKMI
jgi:hypothetical protein